MNEHSKEFEEASASSVTSVSWTSEDNLSSWKIQVARIQNPRRLGAKLRSLPLIMMTTSQDLRHRKKPSKATNVEKSENSDSKASRLLLHQADFSFASFAETRTSCSFFPIYCCLVCFPGPEETLLQSHFRPPCQYYHRFFESTA